MQNLGTARPSDVVEGAENEADDWDIDRKLTAGNVATSSVCKKLQKLQRVCEIESEAVPTAVVDVIELTIEGVGLKRKNATLSSGQTNLEVEPVEIRAARCTMSGQISAAEERVESLKPRLAETQLTLGKLTDESSGTVAEPQPENNCC